MVNGGVPIVTESFGGWHEVAVKEVERLVAVLAHQSGQDCEAGRRLWGRANLPFCCSGGELAILSPLYWDLYIDHLYFQNPENTEI